MSSLASPLVRNCLSALLSCVLAWVWFPEGVQSQERVYFGTYTEGTGSEGIYVADVNVETGQLSKVRLAGKCPNPSFVAIHPQGQLLFAVSEVAEFAGQKSGSVAAFRIDPATGLLTEINHQPTRGTGPCHLVVDRTGKWLLSANYGGGSVCVHPIEPEGKLGAPSSFVQHQGRSANPRRQEAPHAHSINLDASNRFAYVADLGLDRIVAYAFDAEQGRLGVVPQASAQLAPGSGPRHFAFHPRGRFAFTNNELTSSATALEWSAETGTLRPLNTVSSLPSDFTGSNSTAECLVHPNGKFLYVSNRGHDSVALYAIDQATGNITALGHEKTRGKTPRNFVLHPAGTLLLAENQASNTVVAFRVDPATGQLTTTGSVVEVPSPVCARFWAAR